MESFLFTVMADIPNNGAEPLESIVVGNEVAEDLMLSIEIEGVAGLWWFRWLVWVGFGVGSWEKGAREQVRRRHC